MKLMKLENCGKLSMKASNGMQMQFLEQLKMCSECF